MKRQDKAWALGFTMFGLFVIALWGGAIAIFLSEVVLIAQTNAPLDTNAPPTSPDLARDLTEFWPYVAAVIAAVAAAIVYWKKRWNKPEPPPK